MKQLTILVVPISAVGHVNACMGTTKKLLENGHQIVFLVEENYRGKLEAFGYQEFVIDSKPDSVNNSPNPGEALAHALREFGIIGSSTSVETKFTRLLDFFLFSDFARNTIKQTNQAVKEAIHIYRPDLIIVDGGYLIPEVAKSGIPWIKHISTSPLFYLNEPNLPPGGSGFPFNDQSQWNSFRSVQKEFHNSKKFNDHLEEMGYPRYANDEVMPETQILTIYSYPSELNYEIIEKKPWFNLEVFEKNRKNQLIKLETIIPQQFIDNDLGGNFSGKFIYVSMGSMGSVDLPLMKRLVEILAVTNHKYIISMGPRFAEFELAQNMYGERYLAQPKILPHVDLVITHGGNNTVTETFAVGKPMIVLPLFADQYDNAQRLQETGFGLRLDPYNLTNDSLINATECLLNNTEMRDKLRETSKRIQNTNHHEELYNLICSMFPDVQ